MILFSFSVHFFLVQLLSRYRICVIFFLGTVITENVYNEENYKAHIFWNFIFFTNRKLNILGRTTQMVKLAHFEWDECSTILVGYAPSCGHDV